MVISLLTIAAYQQNFNSLKSHGSNNNSKFSDLGLIRAPPSPLCFRSVLLVIDHLACAPEYLILPLIPRRGC